MHTDHSAAVTASQMGKGCGKGWIGRKSESLSERAAKPRPNVQVYFMHAQPNHHQTAYRACKVVALAALDFVESFCLEQSRKVCRIA